MAISLRLARNLLRQDQAAHKIAGFPRRISQHHVIYQKMLQHVPNQSLPSQFRRFGSNSGPDSSGQDRTGQYPVPIGNLKLILDNMVRPEGSPPVNTATAFNVLRVDVAGTATMQSKSVPFVRRG